MAVMELKGPVSLFKNTRIRSHSEHKPAIAASIVVVVIGTEVASSELWKLHRFEIS